MHFCVGILGFNGNDYRNDGYKFGNPDLNIFDNNACKKIQWINIFDIT